MKRLIILSCLIAALQGATLNEKKQKQLGGLFSVVQFDNDRCTTNIDDTTFGICLTSTECTDRSGTAAGNCASGFGVCCFTKVDETSCGGTISNNCTYIQNTAYPGTTTSTAVNCQYTFAASSNICQIRLDFDDVKLSDPATAPAGSVGGCTNDKLTVTSPSGYFIPVLCGTLSGTHMYVETARENPGGTIKIETATAATTRKWKIKAIFLECETNFKAPTDCLQYLTGTSNRLKSFNFGGLMIKNQQYDICIRRERGYCAFQLNEASTTIDSFTLNANAGISDTTAKQGASCAVQFITVQNFNDGYTATTTNRYCGSHLSSKESDTTSGVLIGDGQQFRVGVFSLDGDSKGETTGFDLNYAQIPCNY